MEDNQYAFGSQYVDYNLVCGETYVWCEGVGVVPFPLHPGNTEGGEEIEWMPTQFEAKILKLKTPLPY